MAVGIYQRKRTAQKVIVFLQVIQKAQKNNREKVWTPKFHRAKKYGRGTETLK